MSRIKARWLLIHTGTEVATFSDDDEAVERILDDNANDDYFIVDLAEGVAYERIGVDSPITEHQFDDPEPEEEEDQDD
jgi:hypothetical protein